MKPSIIASFLQCKKQRRRGKRKNFLDALETKSRFSNFFAAAAKAVRAPDGPGRETGTGRVRCRS
jgi:hypothetical protein